MLNYISNLFNQNNGLIEAAHNCPPIADKIVPIIHLFDYQYQESYF